MTVPAARAPAYHNHRPYSYNITSLNVIVLVNNITNVLVQSFVYRIKHGSDDLWNSRVKFCVTVSSKLKNGFNYCYVDISLDNGQ